VRRAVSESARPDLDNLRHAQRSMSAVHLLGRLDGEPVGCGMSSVFPGMTAAPFLWADASVVPRYRRKGIGEALLREVSARGRELGKEGLQLEVREDDEESVRFVEKRGYREIEREKEVVLDLSRLSAPPPLDRPAGVAIVSRADRPDLEREMYEVDREASRDIPGTASEIRQTFEEWCSFAIERPSRDPELTFLALAADRVIGVAYLDVIAGVGYHSLTGVVRDWRGRGVAQALKRAQIAAAHARGLTRLVTESQHDNVPMRRLNEKLGYEPKPGMIVYRGPLL
jgi:ribosomal protein S18 acetylase RimI-like enzyme